MTEARMAYAEYAQVARMNGITPTSFEIWLGRQQAQGRYQGVK